MIKELIILTFFKKSKKKTFLFWMEFLFPTIRKRRSKNDD